MPKVRMCSVGHSLSWQSRRLGLLLLVSQETKGFFCALTTPKAVQAIRTWSSVEYILGNSLDTINNRMLRVCLSEEYERWYCFLTDLRHGYLYMCVRSLYMFNFGSSRSYVLAAAHAASRLMLYIRAASSSFVQCAELVRLRGLLAPWGLVLFEQDPHKRTLVAQTKRPTRRPSPNVSSSHAARNFIPMEIDSGN